MTLRRVFIWATTCTLVAVTLAVTVTNIIVIADLPVYLQLTSSSEEILKKTGEKTIIVLGAGVWRNEPSGMLKCRINKAIALYARERGNKMLLSGDGTDHHYKETNAMREYASINGVNNEDLLTDAFGFSTYDSLRRAAEVFNIKNALIVSQEFHLSRAVWLAGSFAIKATGIPCDSNKSSLYYHLREIPARTKDTLLRWFNSPSRDHREQIF